MISPLQKAIQRERRYGEWDERDRTGEGEGEGRERERDGSR